MQVSAMTFIRHLSEHVSGDLEEIDIRTIAVKNTEVHSALEGVTLPAAVSETLPADDDDDMLLMT
jgi:hypothetical protein